MDSTRRRALASLLLVAAFAVYIVPDAGSSLGRSFPASRLAPALRSATGCITSDDPTTLIELNVLSRNLLRRCPIMVDLTGYSYDLDAANKVSMSRRLSERWQHYAVAYLSSGSVVLISLIKSRSNFNAATISAIESWPVVTRAGSFTAREPWA